MTAKTVGFAVADEDRAPRPPCRPVRSRKPVGVPARAAMRVMAAEERSERLRGLQNRIQAQTGRTYSAEEVNDLVRKVLKAGG